MTSSRALCACVALLIATVGANAQTTVIGRVIGIADGDTITVLDANKQQHRIRLAGIDAPESGQPGGHRSKDSLSAMVYEQPLRVESNKQDRFGRVVGKVWVAPPDSTCRGKSDCPMTLDAGLAQIRLGRAWWFRKYSNEQSPDDRHLYEAAEQEARAKKLGLWRDGKPVPSWEWRDGRRKPQRMAANLVPTSIDRRRIATRLSGGERTRVGIGHAPDTKRCADCSPRPRPDA